MLFFACFPPPGAAGENFAVLLLVYAISLLFLGKFGAQKVKTKPLYNDELTLASLFFLRRSFSPVLASRASFFGASGADLAPRALFRRLRRRFGLRPKTPIWPS